MANEYIDRISNELNRPPSTPEDFATGLAELETSLGQLFVERAVQLEGSEAKIITAQAELSQRIRAMAGGLRPSTEPHIIDILLRYCEISKGNIETVLSSQDIVKSIDSLQYFIVHSSDIIRQAMVDNKAITKPTIKELKKIDGESAYYRPPKREYTT
jgi:hypothetical protein